MFDSPRGLHLAAVAQLGEHALGMGEVRRSIRLGSSILASEALWRCSGFVLRRAAFDSLSRLHEGVVQLVESWVSTPRLRVRVPSSSPYEFCTKSDWYPCGFDP